MKLQSKVPAEIIPITFDFSEIITVIDNVVQTSVSVISGTDDSVSLMTYGAPIITGAQVVQLVRNGVAGNTYNVACLVAKGNERYQIDGNFEVKARHS